MPIPCPPSRLFLCLIDVEVEEDCEEVEWVWSGSGMGFTRLGEIPTACHNRCNSIKTNKRLLENIKPVPVPAEIAVVAEETVGGDGDSMEAEPTPAAEVDRRMSVLFRESIPPFPG